MFSRPQYPILHADMLSSWPALRSFRLQTNESLELPALNPKLNYLSTPFMTSNDVEKLPSTLKSLEFATSTSSEFTTFNIAAALHTLQLTISANLNHFNLDILPASLRKLGLKVVKEREAPIFGSFKHLVHLASLGLSDDSVGQCFHLESSSQLPPSLELLNFDSTRLFGPNFFGPTLALHLPKLKEIFIDGISRTEFSPLESFKWLPPSVTCIRTYCLKTHFWKKEHAQSLPRSLCTLICPGAGGWECNTASALQYLPKTLAYLDILGVTHPDDFAQYLPVPLHHFNSYLMEIDATYAKTVSAYENTLKKKYDDEKPTQTKLY